ncbi:hypothetical protein [Arthrobacter sp. ISL-5]|uniref:hypothetical protein n=1 Tax=Arthrobacter sp. ISL-5 TaxID=2819111 RepID=UPI001BEA3537|nr:hypothetical protein [Arthrobacter sp. ISL-5]MBT2555025.1 hypothetical protein [Arthrobacter sp. ISL-5]
MGGSSMRLVCSAAVRAVLVPAIVALAWLIWGAAAAEASALDAKPAAIAGTASASGAPSAASDLTTSRATKPLLAARVVPSIPNLTASVTTTVSTVAATTAGDADSAAGTADATPGIVTGTTNATLGTVASTADAVIGEADAVVTTVTETAAPVLAEVDKVIDVVEGAVHAVHPVISVPGVLLPAVPTPQPGVTVPGTDPAQAAPSLGADNKSEGTSLARATGGQPLDATGPSLAQLQMTTPHRPATARAVQAAPVGLPHTTPHQEPLASLAKGPSGSSSSGSEGSGAQAADVAGSWSGMHLGAGARTHDANQSVPASPAFDPGSSPD